MRREGQARQLLPHHLRVRLGPAPATGTEFKDTSSPEGMLAECAPPDARVELARSGIAPVAMPLAILCAQAIVYCLLSTIAPTTNALAAKGCDFSPWFRPQGYE